jgi:hypothetical protein
MRIKQLFEEYAEAVKTIEDIRAEIPQLAEAEGHADVIKKQIQDFAKENGEANGSGFKVTLSVRASWDGKALEGYAKAHPEILDFKKVTPVASVKKAG